jgi:hypothetical protein
MNKSIIQRKEWKMFSKRSGKTAFCFFLLALLPNVSLAAPDERPCPGRLTCARESGEEYFLTLLGLREDVNDTELIQLLDIPEKQIFAMGVVMYRKTSPATPKLLQIVNDANMLLPAKICAADTLCYLGNREWMPTIKTLSLDPNGPIAGTSLAIKVAGLLARAGDYSQFEIVAAAVGDSEDYVRSSAIWELANFRHKTDPVTDSAVSLLTSVAMSDPVPRMRRYAIESLEKVAKEKPQIIPKLIDLGITSPVLLKIYELKRNEEESKQP